MSTTIPYNSHRINRTDLTDGPIFDVNGGVWYSKNTIIGKNLVTEVVDSYQRIDVPPVIRGGVYSVKTEGPKFYPILLKEDGYLLESHNLTISDRVKELELVDLIVDNLNKIIVVLTKSRDVYLLDLIGGVL